MGICPAYTDSVSSPEHGTAMHFNGDWGSGGKGLWV